MILGLTSQRSGEQAAEMRLGQEHATAVAAMQAEHELQVGVLEDLVAAANADCQRRLRGEGFLMPKRPHR